MKVGYMVQHGSNMLGMHSTGHVLWVLMMWIDSIITSHKVPCLN